MGRLKHSIYGHIHHQVVHAAIAAAHGQKPKESTNGCKKAIQPALILQRWAKLMLQLKGLYGHMYVQVAKNY